MLISLFDSWIVRSPSPHLMRISRLSLIQPLEQRLHKPWVLHLHNQLYEGEGIISTWCVLNLFGIGISNSGETFMWRNSGFCTEYLCLKGGVAERVSLSGNVRGATGESISELPFLPAENGWSNFLLMDTNCSGLVLGSGRPKTAKGGLDLPTLVPWKGISNISLSTWSVTQLSLGGLRSSLNLTVFVSFNWLEHKGDSVLKSKNSWYSPNKSGMSLISPS